MKNDFVISEKGHNRKKAFKLFFVKSIQLDFLAFIINSIHLVPINLNF